MAPYPRVDGQPLRGPALWRFRLRLFRHGFWFGVRYFQQWASTDGIVVDGLAGPQTWARFSEYEREVGP